MRDLASGNVRLVAGFADADITRVAWVNDDRLVYEAFSDRPVVEEDHAGTFACDHDGSATRLLIAWRQGNRQTGTAISSRVLPYGWFFHSTIDDDSADIFVHRVVRDAADDVKQSQLARLNTRTGELRSLSDGMPEFTGHWLLDARGEPRVARRTPARIAAVAGRGAARPLQPHVLRPVRINEPVPGPFGIRSASR